jgi:HK97 family phage major capsid protein
MPELHELQYQRKNAITLAREIHKRAEDEHRPLTKDEQENYNRYFADQERLRDQIALAERQRELDREAAAMDANRSRPGAPQGGGDGAAAHEVLEMVRDFRGLWIADTYHNERERFGMLKKNGLVNEEQKRRLDATRNRLMTFNSELRRAYNAWWKCFTTGEKELSVDERRDLTEYRDLLMGSDPAGGFTVPPEQFMATLLRKVDDYVYIRRLATKVMVVKAQDLGVPTLEDNPADADWTSELATGTADTVMDFGKRTFAPHPLAKQIRISKKLLRASALDLPELIADRFAYKFGITEEKAFLLGNGAGAPLGVFVASSQGITTARDVNFANSATAISADNLRKVKYTLKAPYRANAQWIFHRDVVAQISLLKDSVGQYLWKDGIQMGDPDMLLGMPVNESEYAPNTMTTGQYLGILGDFSRYWIADSLDMTMQRLVELYAASNQEGFIMRQEMDGMPVFEEAFVRVQLA